MPARITSEVQAQRRAMLEEHYPRGDLQALAAALGCSLNCMQNLASQLGIRRDVAVHRGPRSENSARSRALFLQLAARPMGTTVGEVAGAAQIERKAADGIARQLTRRRDVVSVTISPREVRYFCTQDLADAYAASLRSAAATKATPTVRVPPRIGPAHLPGEPLITEHTKFTLAAPPPRQAYRSNTYLMAG
jgi:hypothetical protein